MQIFRTLFRSILQLWKWTRRILEPLFNLLYKNLWQCNNSEPRNCLWTQTFFPFAHTVSPHTHLPTEALSLSLTCTCSSLLISLLLTLRHLSHLSPVIILNKQPLALRYWHTTNSYCQSLRYLYARWHIKSYLSKCHAPLTFYILTTFADNKLRLKIDPSDNRINENRRSTSRTQCDQMARLCVQYLAIYNNVHSPKSIVFRQSRFKTLPIILNKLCIIAKSYNFCQSDEISPNLVTMDRLCRRISHSLTFGSLFASS